MGVVVTLGAEHGKRVKMFQAFVEAFRNWASKECSSVSFEAGNEPEVVTFRYLGSRLRIRHSFAAKMYRWKRTQGDPENIAKMLPSKLELLEARTDPDNDVVLASLSDIKGDGQLTLPAVKVYPSEPDLWDTFLIAMKPERVFETLVRSWLEPEEPDTPR
jgi:hypothetical protein